METRSLVVLVDGLKAVAFDLLRDTLSAIFGLSELKGSKAQGAMDTLVVYDLEDLALKILSLSFVISSDEELEVPIEDQLLPADASPTTLSPGYIVDSNPKEDAEDPEEDPADYHVDEGDNVDNESSNDDNDDDDVEKDEKDKEEEHLAPIDPSVVPIDDLVP
ncbi:hypothetical protein Tco_1541856 [Tanacetum coccineum]